MDAFPGGTLLATYSEDYLFEGNFIHRTEMRFTASWTPDEGMTLLLDDAVPIPADW